MTSEEKINESRKVIITIPSRSGSKRLLKKNILPINGKPMFYYSIKVAQEANLTKHIYLLSDDQNTLNQAKEFGAIPFLLPSEMAGDTTGVIKASLHALNQLKQIQNLEFDDLICLQPSSPLRIAEDIIKSYLKFIDTKANSLVSMAETDPHYFHWAVKKLENKSFGEMYFGDKFLKPRQELPTMYWPNGAIKIAKIDYLKENNKFFGEKMAVHEMPNERSIHVATQHDFDICKALLEKREEKNR